MPLIALKTNVELDEAKRRSLLGGLSKIVAEDIGKPVQFVMATVDQADIAMGRDMGPAAFADVRSIGGLNKDVNATISMHVAEFLSAEIGVAAERIYMNFSDVSGENWGLGGGVFGG